ncbi:MAG: hypothetical protein K8U57_10115 [Planctomycetes bacterium]|nr:hypothetical protein [Planctomycetota bacterium]
MRTTVIALVSAGVLASGCHRLESTPSTGPNGGDVVPIKNGTAYAELLANADTGEVMVHTWDKNLKTPRPIEKESITVGSGDNSAELMPHPMGGDPPGMSSRFYGHADWMRSGNVRHGWLSMWGEGGQKHSFDWRGCWQGGKAHGPMWEEMGEHRQMGPGHVGPMGTGHHGGGKER